jgi:hypothetical protein
MAENIALTTFNKGVISPKTHDRTDTEMYQSGCRRLENFLVLKEGGVVRRPGTYFIADIQEAPEL